MQRGHVCAALVGTLARAGKEAIERVRRDGAAPVMKSQTQDFFMTGAVHPGPKNDWDARVGETSHENGNGRTRHRQPVITKLPSGFNTEPVKPALLSHVNRISKKCAKKILDFAFSVLPIR